MISLRTLSDLRITGKPAVVWAVSLLVAYLGYAYIFSPPPALTPDSWTFLELARSLSADFYHVPTIRQYCIQTDYDITYPPLWPLLIALYQHVFGEWLLSGVMLSRLIALLTVIPCLVLFRLLAQGGSTLQQARGWYLALVVWMSLVLNPYYMIEVNDGRSIPFSIMMDLVLCCFAVCMHRAAAPRRRHWLAAAMGVIAGLIMLTRFDFFPLAAVIVLLLGVLYGRAAAACCAAALLIILSPWIGYQWLYFHRLFVSDHQCLVFATRNLHTLEFHSSPAPGLFDAPLGWLQRMVGNGVQATLKLLYLTIGNLPSGIMLLGVVCLWVRQRPHVAVRAAAVALLLLAAALLPIVLIGTYAISRHFTAAVLMLTLGCALRLYSTRVSDQSVELFIVMGMVIGIAALAGHADRRDLLPWNTAMVQLDDYREMLPCLPANARVMLGDAHIGSVTEKKDAFQFGYRTQLRTFVLPINWGLMDTQEQEAFVARYHPTRVVTSIAGLVPGMVPTHCPQVYTIGKP